MTSFLAIDGDTRSRQKKERGECTFAKCMYGGGGESGYTLLEEKAEPTVLGAAHNARLIETRRRFSRSAVIFPHMLAGKMLEMEAGRCGKFAAFP